MNRKNYNNPTNYHSFFNYAPKLYPCCGFIPQSIWGVNLDRIRPMCITFDPQPILKDCYALYKMGRK